MRQAWPLFGFVRVTPGLASSRPLRRLLVLGSVLRRRRLGRVLVLLRWSPVALDQVLQGRADLDGYRVIPRHLPIELSLPGATDRRPVGTRSRPRACSCPDAWGRPRRGLERHRARWRDGARASPVDATNHLVSSQVSCSSIRDGGIESALSASASSRVASAGGRRTSVDAASGTGGNGGRVVSGWHARRNAAAASSLS